MGNRTVPVLTAFLAAISVQVQSILSALYHDTTRSPILVTAGGVVSALILCSPVILAAICSVRRRLWQSLAAVLLMFAVYRNLIIPITPTGDLPFSGKMIVAAVFLLGWVWGYKEENQEKLFKILRVGGVGILAWILAMPVLGLVRASSNVVTVEVFDFSRLFNRMPAATAFVLLDEWSPEFSEPVASILDDGRQVVYRGVTKKAGIDTIYAIPSMFTHEQHSQVAPCGFSVLCGSSTFSFKWLRAYQSAVDVVGFHHPYCDMEGLRSCIRIASKDVSAKGAVNVKSVIGFALSELPLVGRFFSFLSDHGWSESKHDRMVTLITEAAFKMPFWNRGGVLYVHQLAPHPKMITGRPLNVEYRENVSRAARFVQEIDGKLRERFGQDYILIVTSDHPLRTDSRWCQGMYSSKDCFATNPPEGDQVPFLVKAPQGTRINMPGSNIGVLAR